MKSYSMYPYQIGFVYLAIKSQPCLFGLMAYSFLSLNIVQLYEWTMVSLSMHLLKVILVTFGLG